MMSDVKSLSPNWAKTRWIFSYKKRNIQFRCFRKNFVKAPFWQLSWTHKKISFSTGGGRFARSQSSSTNWLQKVLTTIQILRYPTSHFKPELIGSYNLASVHHGTHLHRITLNYWGRCWMQPFIGQNCTRVCCCTWEQSAFLCFAVVSNMIPHVVNSCDSLFTVWTSEPVVLPLPPPREGNTTFPRVTIRSHCLIFLLVSSFSPWAGSKQRDSAYAVYVLATRVSNWNWLWQAEQTILGLSSCAPIASFSILHGGFSFRGR